jgi:hypothetical protein
MTQVIKWVFGIKKRHTASPPDWAVAKYGLAIAEKMMLDHIFLYENPVTSLKIEIE